MREITGGLLLGVIFAATIPYQPWYISAAVCTFAAYAYLRWVHAE